MAVEYEKLVAVFEGDVSGLQKSEKLIYKILDDIENRFKNLKTDFPSIGGAGSGGAGKGSPVTRITDEERALRKAAQMAANYGEQLARITGQNSELERLNRTLAQPGVASKIDEATKALLRQKAAAVDLARQNAKGSPVGPPDVEMQKALANIKKFETERQNIAKSSSAAVVNLKKTETKALADEAAAQVRAFKRGMNDAVKTLKPTVPKASDGGSFDKELFGAVFGATTASGLAVNAVESILGGIKTGISAGIDQTIAAGIAAAQFQQTKTAIAGVVGSATEADAAVAKLEKTALNTPGLTFRNALDGYQRLRAVQFGAQDAERALVGLSKVKVLSGGTAADLQAVLINFAQIRSVGKLTGDELRETLGRFPYFAQVLQRAFGTISTEKIGELQLSSEDFFKRIFDEMDKLPTVAGGATEAWEKLVDEFYKAQIAFGEPFLDGATETIKDLTGLIRDNKDTWSEWGMTIAGAVRLANQAMDRINLNKTDKMPEPERIARELTLGTLLPLYGAANFLSSYEKEARSRKPFKETTTSDLSLGDQVFKPKNGGDDEEVRRYKQKIAEIDQVQKTLLTNAETTATRRQALIAGSLRQTTADELVYLRQANQIERDNSEKRLKIIENGISRTRALNEKLIASYMPQDQEKIRQLKERELAESTANLERERAKFQLDEANRKRQILQLEKQITEQIRQSAIETKNLQKRDSSFNFETAAADITRGIEAGTLAAQTGYSRLRQITQSNYEELSRLSIESYQLQLQDLSLTREQRLNLTTQMYLDERKLAEDNARAIREIEDKRFNYSIEQLKRQNESVSAGTAARGSMFGSLQSGFFSRSMNFGDGFDKFALGKTDLTTEIALREKLNDVIEGKSTIYEAQKSLLDKSQKAEMTNLERQKTLYEDLIALERVKLKGQISSNIMTLTSNRAQLLTQASRTTDEDAKAGLTDQANRIGVTIQDWQRTLDLPTEKLNQYFDQNSASIKGYKQAIQETTGAVTNLGVAQAGAQQELFANSPEGLIATYEAIGKGQKDYIIREMQAEELLKDKIRLGIENKALEMGFYKDSELWAERRKNALLNFEREIFEARQNAQIEKSIPIEARLRLSMAQLPSYSEMFKNDIANMPDAMANVLGQISQNWDGTWKGLFSSIKQGFGQMLLDMAQQWMKAAVSRMIGMLVGSLLGGFGGGGGVTNDASGIGGFGISAFAAGGDPPVGRISLVGEKGPELFVPKSAGTIISNDESKRLLNGAEPGGQTIINHNNFTQNIAAPRGLIAPKSRRQAADGAMSGMSRALRGD